MSAIDTTLAERGTRYGNFEDNAFVSQDLKGVMSGAPNWHRLKSDQKEALEMVAHKIGRILNGDPGYVDSWHDIGGYVRLVEQRLRGEQAGSGTGNDKIFATKTGAPIEPSPQDRQFSQKLERKESCDCAACSARTKLEALFPGVEIGVVFIAEESGHTD